MVLSLSYAWLVFCALLVTPGCGQPPTWGFNYDRTSTGPEASGGRDVTLAELFNDLGQTAALAKLRLDFCEMAALNGTAVRLFVNLPDVIPLPGAAPNATMLAFLRAATGVAGACGLTVDLTGSTFERQHVDAAWLAASDPALLDARVSFWGAVSGTLRGITHVRNMNLVNEPFVPWADFLDDVVTGCLPVVRPSNASSTFCYLHPVFRFATRAWTAATHARFPTPEALHAHWPDFPRAGETWDALVIPSPWAPGDNRRAEYIDFTRNETKVWCATLAAAVRAADPTRLVTVGIQFGAEGPDTLTASACSDSLDFFSVHIYPRADFSTPLALEGYFTDRLDLLPHAAARNVTWEELYPLAESANISITDLPGIMLRAGAAARPLAVQSHFSFYWGTAESLDMSGVGAAIYEEWLRIWAAARPW